MSERANTRRYLSAVASPSLESGMLQRKCACGTHTIAGDQCGACQTKQAGPLQRSASGTVNAHDAPPDIHDAHGSMGQPPEAATSAPAAPRFAHDFSFVPLQTRLAAGAPDSPYEREADRVADDLLRDATGPATELSASSSTPDAHQERAELLQRKPAPVNISSPGSASASEDQSELSESFASLINERRGGGQPLPPATRQFFEPRLGYDLSAVRTHTGPRAQEMNSQLQAQAFTLGHDIYFGEGKYEPHAPAGLHLLAHELAHTIQQGAHATPLVQAKNGKPKSKKKVVKVTLMVELDKVVYDLDDGTRITQRTTYNGHPNPGTYLAVRNETGTFVTTAPTGGQTNENDNILILPTTSVVTFDGVKQFYIKVVHGGTPSKVGGGGEGVSPGAGGTEKKGTEKDKAGGDKIETEEKAHGGGGTTKTGETPATTTPMSPAAQEQLRALRELMTGSGNKTDEDPAELLRLFQVLRDTVEDPKFVETGGEPWLRFAKFLDKNREKIEGILRGGDPPGKLTQEKIEKIIAEYGKFISAEPVETGEPKQLETLEDFDKEFKYDPGWQKLSKADRKLLLEYAKMTPEEAAETKINFSRVTPAMKVSMALKLSWKSWPGEIAEAAKNAFSDPTFIITLIVVMGIYVGLWLTPEPSGVTKVFAGALTVALLAQFALEDIYGFAVAYSNLDDECAAATTAAELQAAGDRFAKKVGQVGFDIIMFIVMWRVGKVAGPKLQKIGAQRGVANAEAAVKAAETKPGSGVPKQAVGEAAKVIDMAKGKAKGTTATAVLEALEAMPESLMPKSAKQGLAKLRASAGDMQALKALEGVQGRGQDVGHFLSEKVVAPEVKAQTQAELMLAQGKLARAKLIEMETMKDPALREEAQAEQAKLKDARRAELVNTIRAKLAEWGILKDAGVRKAAKTGDVGELTGQLGEAIQRTLLGSEYPAGKGFRILANIEIVREVKGFDSIPKWQAAEQAAGRPGKVGGLYEAEGKLWKSVTEMDALVVEPTAKGKLRPVELEQMKAGEKSTHTEAQLQNTKALQGLGEIAAGDANVKIFDRVGKNTLGKERTSDFDLTGLSNLKTTTRGTPGKGFTKEIPFGRTVLEWVAKSLIELGLPRAEPQIIPPVTPKRDPTANEGADR